MALTITPEDNGRLIYQITGQFDAQTVKDYRPQMEAQLTASEGVHIFNFSETNFIDSSGIGAIVFMFKRLSAQDKKLAVVGLSGQPADLIKMLRIDKVIDTYDTIENVPG